MRAKDVMSKGVVSVLADASLLEAATYLVNMRAAAMPVLDKDGVLVGIVTEADLIPYAGLAAPDDAASSAAAISSHVRGRKVSEVMSRPVITVDADAPLRDVVVLMAGKRLKQLPVRAGDSIVGMIGRIDLLKVILSQAAAIAPLPVTGTGGVPHDDNAEVRRTVLKALRGHAWSSAEGLDVVVIDGAIHLWGTVPNQETLRAYQDAAQSIANVKDVISHMQIVRPAQRRPFTAMI